MTETLTIPGHKIERMLAKGGMAEVYLAEQLSLGRKVAIKVMDANTSDAEFAERFLHEARLVAALNHTNLITIYDFGQLNGGKLFLSMEYLQGGDLEERLVNGIPEKMALHILRQLASVLRFVHSHNIAHRDIKPANILFRGDNTLVLTDFGIAKEINNDVGLTQAGMVVGSAAYSSPEQMQGMSLDTRTDMYSLGVLLLEMLTGTNPFKADTFINTAMNHIQMDVPRLTGHQARFQPLLDNMLAKKPAERFASMAVLMEALDKIAPLTSISPMPDYASAMSPDRRKSASPSVHVGAVQTAVTSPQKHVPLVKTESPNSISTSASLDTSADEFQSEFLAEAEKLLHASEVIISHPVPTRKSPAPKPTTSSHTPGRSSTTTGSGRTRPLPSNLFDD